MDIWPARLALTLSVLLCALVAAVVAAVVIAPGTAHAETATVKLEPAAITAGGTLRVNVNCGESDKGTVDSPVFGTKPLIQAGGKARGTLTTEATIGGNATAGNYEVKIKCDKGGTATATLTIVASAGPASSPAPKSPTPSPTVRMPGGGSQTGGGGLGGAGGLATIAAGLALAVGGILLGAMVLRRRQRGAAW